MGYTSASVCGVYIYCSTGCRSYCRYCWLAHVGTIQRPLLHAGTLVAGVENWPWVCFSITTFIFKAHGGGIENIPTARRSSSSVVNSRSRAFRYSICIKNKVAIDTIIHSARLEPTKLILVGTRTTYQATGDAGYLVLFTCSRDAHVTANFLAKAWTVPATGKHQLWERINTGDGKLSAPAGKRKKVGVPSKYGGISHKWLFFKFP